MPEIKSEDRVEFKFVIDEEYVNSIMDGVFEAEFAPEQWDELFDRIGEPIYCAVYDTVSEILDEAELEKNNEGAEKIRPCYLVKYRHPNAFVREWQDMAYLKTEKDAQSYIKYHNGGGEDEEWKVEKVE